jgi:hypothetical protein
MALATLVRLQASGVSDIDLLDSMLERGEAWLDHTLQLLEECERLNVIGGDYTRWCQLALEGAYDWITSMLEAGPSLPAAVQPSNPGEEATEELLLQKLMSDDETLPAVSEPTRVLTDTPFEEMTGLREVEILSVEEHPVAEEIEVLAIEEPTAAEEGAASQMSEESVQEQTLALSHEALSQEQGVDIPDTPRPEILGTEPEGREAEEELVPVAQGIFEGADEDIHAVEEIMYFTEEAPWQWEESVPPLPDTPTPVEIAVPLTAGNEAEQEEERTEDLKPAKLGFFQRIKRAWKK